MHGRGLANNGCSRTRCQQPLRAVPNEVTQRNLYAFRSCGAHPTSVQPLHDVRRCLVVHSCSRTSEFAVREITAEDVQTLTDIQTDAFFEPAPMAFLNGFFRSLFRVSFLPGSVSPRTSRAAYCLHHGKACMEVGR